MFFLFAQQLIFDDEIESFCHQIVKKISCEMGIKDKDIPIYLIDTDEANAAAAGPGVMLIHTGLIAECKTAEEFIGVIAHELGHIQKEHSFYFYHAAKMMQLAISTGLGVGIILAPITGGLSLLALPILAAGSQQEFFSYRRVQEFEADQKAVHVLKKMGWPTEGLSKFLERLIEYDFLMRIVGLSTHPLSRDRINRIKEMTGDFKGTLDADVIQKYARIRSKILGYMRKNVNASDAYERALAFFTQRYFTKAIQTLDQMLEKEKDDIFYKEIKASALFLNGNVTEAKDLYQEILQKNKELKYMPLQFVACAILLKSDLDMALKILSNARFKEPQAPYLWHLTGHVYQLKNALKTMWFCRCRAAFLMGNMAFVRKHIDQADTKTFPVLYQEMKQAVR